MLPLAEPAAGGVTPYASRVDFEAQGTIAENYGFDDFGPGFSNPGDPWTAHGVTYQTGQNLIVGTGTSYAPVSNVFAYNQWTPIAAAISVTPTQFDMFGFDLSYLGANTAMTITVTTSAASYVFPGLTVPLGSVGRDFYGFIADAGEHIVSFTIASAGGNGSAPVIDNVTLGVARCGNNTIEIGEECDDGNHANGDCCSSTCQYETNGSPCATDGEACTADVCDGAGACTHAAGNGGASCRAAVDTCDVAELCDGVSPTCPADAVVGSGTPCRAPADLCDAEELCDGVSPLCPNDGALAGGTECRAAAGDCDLAEQCDGASAACPADLKSTAPCRPAADTCDVAESCDGIGDECPADGFATTGTPCRADGGDCDLAETCTGSAAACPADATEPDGTTCDDADTCSQTDTCLAGVCTGADPLDCDDGNGCTADSCDPMGGCVNDDAPAPSCLTAGKSIVLIKDNATDDSKDKLLFKWIKGAALSQMDLADPVASAAYALCVYAGTTNALIADAALPPGPSWSAIGTKGYKFKGTSPGGLSLAILKGGAAGKSKALAKGKGAALPDPTLPVAYPVTVQIKKAGSPLCLESVFSSLDEKKNTDAQFKAKK